VHWGARLAIHLSHPRRQHLWRLEIPLDQTRCTHLLIGKVKVNAAHAWQSFTDDGAQTAVRDANNAVVDNVFAVP
jgi:hypothetical protein